MDVKLTCLAYVLAIIYVIDEILVLSGLKSEYFRLAYVEMICLVGILHAIEGILIFSFGGNQNVAIITYKGKKVAGGYQSYGRWFIPLLLFSINGLYVPIVAMLVYLNESFVLSSKAKARYMGIWIFIYGLGIIMLGYFTKKGNLPLLLTMLTMPLLHEILFAIDYHIEQGDYLYPYPNQGIRVMDFKNIIQKDRGHIEKGDIILKINNTRINSEETYDRAIVKDKMNMVVQKVNGEILQVSYTYEELEGMKLIFLPPL